MRCQECLHRFAVSILLVVLLAGCAGSEPTALSPVESTPTAEAAPTTTPFPDLDSTPAVRTPTPTPTGFRQVYWDAEGWFSVNFPSSWKLQRAGFYSGDDGFFEIDYLPEMRFMRDAADVCQWFANVDTHSTYNASWPGPLSSYSDSCRLKTLPHITPAVAGAVVANPEVDNDHRFLIIKTDPEHFQSIIDSFSWRRSIDVMQEKAYHLLPPRAGDAAFWETTGPLPDGISVKEFLLPQEAQEKGPHDAWFDQYLPPEAKPTEDPAERSEDRSDDNPTVEEQLAAIGYELRTDRAVKPQSQLYRDGTLLIDDVLHVRKVYSFSAPSGPIDAFVVSTIKLKKSGDMPEYNGYLVQNGKILAWGSTYHDPFNAPILHQGELYWLRADINSLVTVETSSREVIFSFDTYFGASLPIFGFQSWNDHWILQVDEFLIVDGEILNETYGFEEAFGWRIIDEKPFYFFRKGPRMGLSYNGVFSPLPYQEVIHNMCCGLARNNPSYQDNTRTFYAKRDGNWYYVVMTFE